MTKKELLQQSKTEAFFKHNMKVINVLLKNNQQNLVKLALFNTSDEAMTNFISNTLAIKDLLYDNKISKLEILKFINSATMQYLAFYCSIYDCNYKVLRIFEYDFFKNINDVLQLTEKDKQEANKTTVFKVYKNKKCDKTDYILFFIDLLYSCNEECKFGLNSNDNILRVLSSLMYHTANDDIFNKIKDIVFRLPQYKYDIRFDDELYCRVNFDFYIRKLTIELFKDKQTNILEHIFNEQMNRAIAYAYFQDIRKASHKNWYMSDYARILEDKEFKEKFDNDFIETLALLIKVLSKEDETIDLNQYNHYAKSRINDFMLLKEKMISCFYSFDELNLTLKNKEFFPTKQFALHIKEFLQQEHFELLFKAYSLCDSHNNYSELIELLNSIDKTDSANIYVLMPLAKVDKIFEIVVNHDKYIIDTFILKAKQKQLLNKFNDCYDCEKKKQLLLDIQKLQIEWLKIIKHTSKTIQYVSASLQTTEFIAKSVLLREWTKEYLNKEILTQIEIYLLLNQDKLLNELKNDGLI